MRDTLRYLLFRVKVRGESLWPELVPGRWYWASSAISPTTGNYIVFPDPSDDHRMLVKKVQAVYSQELLAGGTVPWSSSSYRVLKQSVIGTIFNARVR